MTDTGHFTYRRAPLSGPETWHIDGAWVSRTVKTHTDTLNLTQLGEVRFWSQKAQRNRMMGLELRDTGGTHLPLRLTRPVLALSGGDDGAHVWRATARAVLEAMRTHAPDHPIALGHRSLLKWLWCLLGFAMVAFAMGIPVLAYLDGRSDRLGAVMVPISILGLLGAATVYLFWPFRKPVYTTAEQALQQIDEMEAGSRVETPTAQSLDA